MVVHTCQSQSPNSFPLTTLCPLFVLYICISFPALQVSSSIPFFYIPHIYVLIYSICFFLSDLYFILYISRSIYNSTNDPILLFLWLNNIPLYTHHVFFIHSSLDGHLGCFHVLGVVNSAAVNVWVHVSFWIMVFSGYMLSSRIAGSYGSSIFSFLRNLCTALLNGYISRGKKRMGWVGRLELTHIHTHV